MATEIEPAPSLRPSTRATVARLTLQLRAAERAADAAEAGEAGWDLDVAIQHLRDRMRPLIEQRRQELAAELEGEREAAAAAVEEARRQAAEIVAATVVAEAAADITVGDALEAHDPAAPLVAWDHVAEIDEPSEDDAIAALAVPATDDDEPSVEHETDLVPVAVVTPPVEWPSPSTSAGESAPVPLPPPAAPVGPVAPAVQVQVVLDEATFAKAFALALIEHGGRRPTELRVVTASPARRGFWAHAWHADVLLSMGAVAIVIAVLVAWSV